MCHRFQLHFEGSERFHGLAGSNSVFRWDGHASAFFRLLPLLLRELLLLHALLLCVLLFLLQGLLLLAREVRKLAIRPLQHHAWMRYIQQDRGNDHGQCVQDIGVELVRQQRVFQTQAIAKFDEAINDACLLIGLCKRLPGMQVRKG